MTTALLNFYRGTGQDNLGRTLEEMWAWDDHRLEHCHNYIQWMFPSDEPSAFNGDAPVLTDDEIQAFQSSDKLQVQLRTSFAEILAFYGFQLREGNGELSVEKTDRFEAKAQNWLTTRNHNHLRITRILKCLRLTGLERYAQAFLFALEGVGKQRPDVIGEETLRYWRSAVK